MEPLLRVNNLSKSFGTLQAVRGVSFDVAAGEVVGLAGRSGAGKSVIANVLAGTAPHELVHDPARGFLYVANSLDQTISVIDVARDRPTRFTEVARIGLEEPYSR